MLPNRSQQLEEVRPLFRLDFGDDTHCLGVGFVLRERLERMQGIRPSASVPDASARRRDHRRPAC
jgi:hypothetical protein